MLELFKTNKNHFIGVDFGTSSIKVVELSYTDQQTHLENYGFVDLNLPSHDNSIKPASLEQALNDSLKKLIIKMNARPAATYVSIPGFSGLVTIVELPDMPDDELTKAIQFEAHKYIPSALEEVAMSWEVIERKTDAPKLQEQESMMSKLKFKSESKNKTTGKIKVLLVAAPKKDIEHCDRLVSGAGLEVSAIELETFSIARSLVGDSTGTFLIVDVGSRATNIILVEKGVIQVNRNIDAGGDEITSAIADGMNISRARADVFKKGEKDMLNGNENAIIIPVLDLIVGELRRIIAAYKEKNNNSVIEALIISGGTSKMKGIEEFFNRSLGEKIQIGNPWRSIVVKAEVAPFVKEIGSSFSVALGLAMRGIDDYKRK
ncbi:MAG: pilus assembly protein PilM [Candidatus Moraniibacteriota bacterium]